MVVACGRRLTMNPIRRPYVFSPVYNASKAALHAYSDTLRVELSPFDVRVLVLVTGGVKTDLARTDRTLPEGSYYTPLADVYKGRLTYANKVGVDPEIYAKRVVYQILAEGFFASVRNALSFGARSRWLWEGTGATLVWFTSNFLPRALLVSILKVCEP